MNEEQEKVVRELLRMYIGIIPHRINGCLMTFTGIISLKGSIIHPIYGTIADYIIGIEVITLIDRVSPWAGQKPREFYHSNPDCFERFGKEVKSRIEWLDKKLDWSGKQNTVSGD